MSRILMQGERNPRLTSKQEAKIRMLYDEYHLKIKVIASRFGVSNTTIGQIVHRKGSHSRIAEIGRIARRKKLPCIIAESDLNSHSKGT